MTDAESLQQLYNPRSRWPYRCVVASIALLYLLLMGTAVWILISMPISDTKSEQTQSGLRQAASDPSMMEKTRVFYLKPKSDEVKNQTMDWKSSVPGTYNDTQRAFVVPRKGNYLLGVNLVLQCETDCPTGSLKLNFTSDKGHLKSCRMNLEKEPPSCIHMLDLPAASRMMVSMGAQGEAGKLGETWKVDVNRSQWWIFISDE
ncbi:uncharacterized protein [Paramormyrops kingsleyae]|uniref:uncharacterized protein n=1 Tax=Paramormyrops kingsleyae TaxID=1676925 RepID=UPI000CD67294|nr:uncharacterized protein LOC111859935 [Paramormyrops kingsleyae]